MIKLSPLIGDHAVFADNGPVPVSGLSDGPVTVSFAGKTVTATPENGVFAAYLPQTPAGGPYTLTVESNGETVEYGDIYVGRVYLLAGQSNAEFRLEESDTDRSEYMTDPYLRNCFIPRPWIQNDIMSGGWRTARAENVGSWSAVAYLTGKAVREKTGGAVGFVSCFQGASVIESWLPREKAAAFSLPPDRLHIDHTYPEYASWNSPGVIYETMLSPLFPFRFSGVVWYQGESDTTVSEAEIYGDELGCLISTVRDKNNDPSLPFTVVQIADFDPRNDDGWHLIQAAQAASSKHIPFCKTVRSADVCQSAVIHPPTKSLLSNRIAKALTE